LSAALAMEAGAAASLPGENPELRQRLHFLGERAWSVEVRYLHISNAGLSTPNPGINTLQVRVGIGKFFSRK